MAFSGSFDHLLDEKGRVSIPTRFREHLRDGAEEKLFLTNAFGGTERCLVAYTVPGWADIVTRFARARKFDVEVEKFAIFYIGNAHELVLDRQGRILIPPKLRVFAGLDREVTAHGMGDRFQIWDTPTLQRVLEGIVAEHANNPGLAEKLNL